MMYEAVPQLRPHLFFSFFFFLNSCGFHMRRLSIIVSFLDEGLQAFNVPRRQD